MPNAAFFERHPTTAPNMLPTTCPMTKRTVRHLLLAMALTGSTVQRASAQAPAITVDNFKTGETIQYTGRGAGIGDADQCLIQTSHAGDEGPGL